MVSWPQELVRAIARRKCVLVVGSGLSKHAKGKDGRSPPTWKEFLVNSNQELIGGPCPQISSAIDSGDYLHACEWLKNKYDHRWVAKLRNVFLVPEYEPNDVHELIARMDLRVIFSLNFDDILDRRVKELYRGNLITKNYHDEDVSEFLRGDGRYLVKVHGSMDQAQKIIFTQREYAEARVKYASFYGAFDSALMSNTFLFIGAGWNDPDINLILENQKFLYSELHPHYFLAPSSVHGYFKKSLRNNRNLELIEYDKIDENHLGFVDAIRELVELVEQDRAIVAAESLW